MRILAGALGAAPHGAGGLDTFTVEVDGEIWELEAASSRDAARGAVLRHPRYHELTLPIDVVVNGETWRVRARKLPNEYDRGDFKATILVTDLIAERVPS